MTIDKITLMNGDVVEVGKCDICGKNTSLITDKYEYKINCSCHPSDHVEIVKHCKKCNTGEPITTIIQAENGERYLVPTACLHGLDHILEGYELLHFLRNHGSKIYDTKFRRDY